MMAFIGPHSTNKFVLLVQQTGQLFCKTVLRVRVSVFYMVTVCPETKFLIEGIQPKRKYPLLRLLLIAQITESQKVKENSDGVPKLC